MRWYELVIEGPQESLEAFLDAHPGNVYRNEDLKLETESLTDRARDFLRRQKHHMVFTSAGHARELLRALHQERELRLEAVREVLGGGFRFDVEAYSQEVAAGIQEALEQDLPPGISILEREQEEHHPEAKGIELFAPAHEYVYRTRGRITGSAPGILEMDRRLGRLHFVKEEPLVLEYRDASPDELL